MGVTLLLWAVLGHAVLWVAFVNRNNAAVVHRGVCKTLGRSAPVCCLLVPLAGAVGVGRGDVALLAGKSPLRLNCLPELVRLVLESAPDGPLTKHSCAVC